MPRARSAAAAQLHLVPEIGVGQDLAPAALVDRDQRGVIAAASFHVAVEAEPGEVRLGPAEPAERRGVGLEHAVPPTEPGQLAGGTGPEALVVRVGLAQIATNDRIREVHRRYSYRQTSDCERWGYVRPRRPGRL